MSSHSHLQQIAPNVWKAPAEPIYGLAPVSEAKLLQNQSWLACRSNSLGLCHNPLARNISPSFGFPQDTRSREVQELGRQGLIARRAGTADQRRQILSLADACRAILRRATPRFVTEEAPLLNVLSVLGRAKRARPLSKIVISAARRPEVAQRKSGETAICALPT